MVRSPEDGGWGLDGVWADDFHHQMRRRLAGDTDGYFADFTGTTEDLAETLRAGWFFRGQHSTYQGGPRGTDPSGVPLARFVVCLQNHDQIGNRAFGERLHHQADPAAYRAALAVLLTAPETPLLFMGQEWTASTPFLYFTDHNEALGRLVTEGRRREFGRFAAFADPAVARGDSGPPGAGDLRGEPARLGRAGGGRAPGGVAPDAGAAGAASGRARARARRAVRGDRARRRHAGARVRAGGRAGADGGGPARRRRHGGAGRRGWPRGARPGVALSTEDPAFSPDPRPPVLVDTSGAPAVRFDGPAALVLRWP